jgi:predicted RND superfamily exporter protein
MVSNAILTNDIYFNVPFLFFSITIMAIIVGLGHNYCIMVLVEGWIFKP